MQDCPGSFWIENNRKNSNRFVVLLMMMIEEIWPNFQIRKKKISPFLLLGCWVWPQQKNNKFDFREFFSPTGVWTQDSRFKVSRANHYTIREDRSNDFSSQEHYVISTLLRRAGRNQYIYIFYDRLIQQVTVLPAYPWLPGLPERVSESWRNNLQVPKYQHTNSENTYITT